MKLKNGKCPIEICIVKDKLYKELHNYAIMSGTSESTAIIFFLTKQVNFFSKANTFQRIWYEKGIHSVSYTKKTKKNNYYVRKVVNVPENLYKNLKYLKNYFGYSSLNELISRMLRYEIESLNKKIKYSNEEDKLLKDEVESLAEDKNVDNNRKKEKRMIIPMSEDMYNGIEKLSRKTGIPASHLIKHMLVNYIAIQDRMSYYCEDWNDN